MVNLILRCQITFVTGNTLLVKYKHNDSENLGGYFLNNQQPTTNNQQPTTASCMPPFRDRLASPA
jgi:hypothetical protein